MANVDSPTVSVVMPVYQVERFVAEAVRSVLEQSFGDFELLIVDDGGRDGSIAICESFADPRIRIIHQANRGLAGARNTGILAARAPFIAFLDSDDRWLPEKLALHLIHLRANPELGVSFSPSRFIDEAGQPMRLKMTPKLDDITPQDIFCRNPVGNGSAPVIRATALGAIAFPHPADPMRLCFFDESLRQSEDIECWMRLALLGRVRFGGIAPALTEYRVCASGLSTAIVRQYETWLGVLERICAYAPEFTAAHGERARAYQLRYLARRSVQLGDANMAMTLLAEAMRASHRPLIEEPVKSGVTIGAAMLGRVVPAEQFARLAGRVAGGRLVA